MIKTFPIKQKLYLFILIFIFTFQFNFAQTVTFNVSPVAYYSGWGGATLFAAWITDINGNNLKTLNCRAKTYIVYLSNWRASFNGGAADATTGATYSSIPIYTVTWNCNSRDGMTVPNGNYYFNVEYSQQGTSKFAKYAFSKTADSQTYSFPNSTYFTNVSITYNSPTSAVAGTSVDVPFNCYVIPGAKKLIIDYDPDEHRLVNVSIYDTKGMLLSATGLNVGYGNLEYNLATLLNGIYIVKITDKKHHTESHKVILR
ncbi:T9SS type A sorting domain-containing protein [Parabacteroides sp. FAFU027]|uniref:T9SS type A sorting domain-containing protein n=1 Tax=Parabacteroides sp. FAFU027 TaxID=2922715 RepID=UPI001FAED0C9|nr:T9SS type A sorting domain-containing protein [Parabacteroides sp. FAFU027]